MLENICIRILILDISEKKSNHELYGFTVHEEYNFYIKHFWKNESYKCDLAIRYAEGSRLQKLKEKYFVILQNEINEKINIDKDMISKKFHENMNEFQMLNKDQGDIHKNGRSVSKIEFDNGSILYYKPHSLDNNVFVFCSYESSTLSWFYVLEFNDLTYVSVNFKCDTVFEITC